MSWSRGGITSFAGLASGGSRAPHHLRCVHISTGCGQTDHPVSSANYDSAMAQRGSGGSRRTQRVTTADGLDLEVADAGEGPPVLLLHGFPDSLAMWDSVADRLLAAGHRVIAYDQRGFGASSAPAERRYYAFDRIVEDAVDVLSALGVRERITVVGHDWGAFISWALCSTRPALVDRHVAISTGHPRAARSTGFKQMRKNFYVPLFLLPGIGEWLLSRHDFALFRHIGATHPNIDEVIAKLEHPGRLTAELNWYRKNTVVLATRRWGRCPVPTLGVFPADDAYFTEEQMTRSKAHMDARWRYERIDAAGHYAPVEQPDRVAALIADWARSA